MLVKCRRNFVGCQGGPQWTDPNNRPEQGLLALRKSLGLFANIRPTKVTEGTSHFFSQLKNHVSKERILS